jgi:ATP-binding cassette subfamily F protein 3
VITAEGLVVRRGQRTIVPGLDLFVRRGDRIALVGPNGSGKSTTLDVLRGARAPDAGSVRHGVGLRLARADQTAEPWGRAADDGTTIHHGAATVGHMLRDLNPGITDTDIWRVTASVGVPSAPERPLSDLSGGERRRLTLARIAVTDAHLLVLDEPTHHLDVRAVEALESLLESFTGTLLLATHDRLLVERLATSVWRFGDHGLDPDSVVPG